MYELTLNGWLVPKKALRFDSQPNRIFLALTCFKTCLTPTFSHLQGRLCSDKASKDEHGEEDHGASAAGGVQSPGQCTGSDAPAAPLLRTVSSSSSHDPEGAGGEALYDASCI